MKKLRVLVACEFSGIVREAFAALGHDAWSCDLLPSESTSGTHLMGDVIPFLGGVFGKPWDLMIAHPPCTYLCSSGLHWNKRRPGRDKLTEDAMTFVRRLIDAPIPRIALENPIGCISSKYRKPDQIIQPWQFGDDASKATCLWLKGLNPLKSTNIIPPLGWKRIKFSSELFTEGDESMCDECGVEFADCDCFGPTQDGVEYREIFGVLFGRLEGSHGGAVWSNQTPSGQNKLGPSPQRAAERAKTYRGIASAMARQWSDYCQEN